MTLHSGICNSFNINFACFEHLRKNSLVRGYLFFYALHTAKIPRRMVNKPSRLQFSLENFKGENGLFLQGTAEMTCEIMFLTSSFLPLLLSLVCPFLVT